MHEAQFISLCPYSWIPIKRLMSTGTVLHEYKKWSMHCIFLFLTGAQTRFTFELPNHRLRFTSKVSATDMSTIPPSASLNLPPVTMSGKYVMEEHDSCSEQVWSIDELPSKQGCYLQGNYLRCVAEVRMLSVYLFRKVYVYKYIFLLINIKHINNH